MFILLQSQAIEVTPAEVAAPESPVASFLRQFLPDFLVDGGWPMIPLVILLGVAIYIFIERYLTIRKANTDSEEFMKQVRNYVQQGKLDAALGLCESQNDPFARMIHKGISRLGTASLKDIEGSIENVGKLEVYRLERRLSLLATIAGAAPMIGFMGTVLGMIRAFNAIVAKQGKADPTDLAAGISEAMITTASGLVVGIIAYLAYNSLVALVNKVVFKLELTSTDFLDLLQEPVKS
ncbi:MAG: MotA/TolQ/ExbB proton channel family protein [Bacteroidota bacterium]